ITFSQTYSLNGFINELKQYQKVELHESILKVIGIFEQSVDEITFFREYAYDGTLRQYLEQNFCIIDWNDRLHLAKQLVSAVKCLHENDIIHMNLNSENIFVHKGDIKINIFKYQNKCLDESKFTPYIDPQYLQSSKTYNLNKSSDIYSIGVLIWEISSRTIPFRSEFSNVSSLLKAIIIDRKRETAVLGTPKAYEKIYTKCWQHESLQRPTIQEVFKTLNSINFDDICKEENEIKYGMNRKYMSDKLMHYIDWRNETVKELKLISSIITSFKKTTSLSIIETLKEENGNCQGSILDITSLPAFNLRLKHVHGELRFLYGLNRLFLSQFDKQGISETTTCSIICQIERYISNHDTKPNLILKQYCNHKYKHYFTSIIGFFYEYGIGTDVNHYMAYDMYSKAIKDICVTSSSNDQDNLSNNLLKENQRIGLISLGLLYKYGRGIEVNQLKAFRLFLKSISKGSLLGIIKQEDTNNNYKTGEKIKNR
ncbi:10900_t:CDS:2, partial [Cetraspora pellucida]